MSDYLFDLKMAAIFFPFIALLVSIPFILIEYHKYGSISFFKSVVSYSFVLYIICAYFLIILPLPSKSEVALLTTPTTQLIPFEFIIDAIKHFSPNLAFLKSSYVYVPLFNIILTIPFGIYLSYLFKCDFKKTVLFTFLLSLFFELTQLSGLYFIYERGYRLCDIDDLLLNTLGGLIGYFTGGLITKPLPTVDKLNDEALSKGSIVTGFKRTTSLFLDMFIFMFISTVLYIIFRTRYVLYIMLFIHYILMPILLKGSTIGQKWLNLKIVNKKEVVNIFRTIFRTILFVLIYVFIPFTIMYQIEQHFTEANEVFICIIYGILLIFYMITAIKYLFTNKGVLYETISGTHLISTIKKKELK